MHAHSAPAGPPDSDPRQPDRSGTLPPDRLRQRVLNWLDERSARLALLAVVSLQMWVAVAFIVLNRAHNSATSINYIIAAPVLTAMLVAYWRGWDHARYVVVLTLSILLPATAPQLDTHFPYPPQGLILPSAVATLLTGPRWIIGSAILVFAILFVRAGGIPAGLAPQSLVSTSIIIAALAAARLVLDANARQSREQARLADEARQEAERRASEVRFQAALLNAVDEALVAVSTDGTIMYWNRGAELLMGATAQERVGTPIRLEGDPQREFLRAEMLAGQPFSGEVQLRRRDGTVFPALVHTWPFNDADGVRLGSVSVTLDLTERRRIEDELRQSEARVRQAQHVARLGVWDWDVRTDVTVWSAEMFEIYGIDPATFTGRGQDYLHQTLPEDREKQLANIQRSIEYARTHAADSDSADAVSTFPHYDPQQFRIVRPDGSIRWVEGDAVVQLDSSGEPVRMLGVLIDITERKRAEIASREARDLAQALVENTVDGIIRISQEGTILSVNSAVETIFGFSPVELVGQNVKILMPEPDRSAHDGYLARYRETGHAAIIGAGREVVGQRKDGQRVLIDLAVSEFWYEGQRQFVGTLRDITERRLIDERLRQTQKMEALGQMASGIAHDFNNALTMIVGGTEILQLRPDILRDEAQLQKYLKLMSVAAEDAGAVVARLRELYRPRGEGAPFQSFDLSWLVRETVELTRPRWQAQAQAEGRQIDIEVHFEEAPPVIGSPAELRETLTNLIFNAVDAMPDGGRLTIRISADPNHVILQVADTGVGMTEDVRLRCLEPFFTTKGERGSGLGLGMVYGTVKRHNGDLSIDSVVGAGTTFTLRLPAADQQGRDTTAAPVGAPTRAFRVLVVDDEPRIADIVRVFLSSDGHEVDVAWNGADALAKLRASRFDVLITDRAMPEMSGDQLALLAKAAVPHLRVVMLSGFSQALDGGAGVPPGVDAMLDKPLQPATLRRTMSEIMAAHGPRPHGAGPRQRAVTPPN